MMPTLTDRTKATLLLAAPLLPQSREFPVRQLNTRDYWALELALSESGCRIDELFESDLCDLIGEFRAELEGDRIRALLGRGLQLANSVEKWHKRGIWVIGSDDTPYPEILKTKLGNAAPPVLYGCGDPALFNDHGLAIVGSRNASDAELGFARAVAEVAVFADIPIVSGGARGIDASAMRAALRAGGKVIGVLPMHLDRAVVAKENRAYLRDGKLLLISPFDPSAGFNVGNAMARNQLIYTLARAALVASVEYGKGGTWNGATEQLNQPDHIPVFVNPDANTEARRCLIERGATEWTTLACVPQAPNTLFRQAEILLTNLDGELSRKDLQAYLQVTKSQLDAWMPELLGNNVLERTTKPRVRYRPKRPTLAI